MLAGSGAYGVNTVPGFSLADELESLHNAGLSRYAALQTATANISHFYQLDRGTIAEGMKVELLLLAETH